MQHISPPNRILDPVHGLIQFSNSDFDRLVLSLLDSPVVQRLRGIQQLGLTSLVYPTACHSRFSHSLGVFAVARKIMQRIVAGGAAISQTVTERTLLAALLHDIGHGPYSHVFERVQADVGFHHETMSQLLLQHPTIKRVFADAGRLDDWQALQPDYDGSDAAIAAVVSGTFDADRLDYLHRDQMLSGSCQGRFDWPWLLDNLEWDDQTQRLVLNHRTIHAAEEYLLARSHLYQTVYFHRTVRGAEGMLTRLLRLFADHCRVGTIDDVADIPRDFPLRRWFSQSHAADADLYLPLDDAQVQMLLWLLRDSNDADLRRYAALRQRHLHHCLEPAASEKPQFLAWLAAVSPTELEDEWGVFSEHLCFTAYDQTQPIMLRTQGGTQGGTQGEYHELSTLSFVAQALTQPIDMLRLYSDDYDRLLSLQQHVLGKRSIVIS